MSWGEKSCIHIFSDSKPCKPLMETCNVVCEHYKWNGQPSYEKAFEDVEVGLLKKKKAYKPLTKNQRKRAAKKRRK